MAGEQEALLFSIPPTCRTYSYTLALYSLIHKVPFALPSQHHSRQSEWTAQTLPSGRR